MPTHTEEERRRRRDTPAQSRVSQDSAQRRTSAISAARGRDTPAQERNLQRQQTPAQGRTVARERIDRELARADRIGDRNVFGAVGRSARGAVGEPDLGPPITPADIARQQQQAGRIQAAGRGALETLRAGAEGVRGSFGAQAPAPAGPGAPTRMPAGPGVDWQGVLRHFTDIPEGASQVGGARRGGRGAQPAPSAAGAAPQGRTAQEVLRDVNRGAIGSAREAEQGFFVRPDGTRVSVPGTQRVPTGPGSVQGPSVIGDLSAAEQEFARANAIRQEMIDAQRPQQQVTTIPDSGAQQGRGTADEIRRLIRQAGSTRDSVSRAGINRQIRQLQGEADRESGERAAAGRDATTLQAAAIQQQGAMDRTLVEAQARAAQGGQLSGTDIFNLARADMQQWENQRRQSGAPLERPEPNLDVVRAYMEGGNEAGAEAYLDTVDRQSATFDLWSTLQQNDLTMDDAVEDWEAGRLQGTILQEQFDRAFGQSFAMGGLVEPPQSYQAGGMVSAARSMEDSMGPMAGPTPVTGSAMGAGPQAMAPPMMAEYQQYAAGAQQLGIQAVPYEEFLALQPQAAPPAPGPAQQGAIGLAEGGMVPGMDPQDASGQMLVDPNPNAGTDSIPAMIDGQHPANLDSGEFVIPKHVVMFHGIDKLQKLIAQAEKDSADGTNGRADSQTATGLPA